jgi:ATP adenylyltransferase
MNQLFAPWRIEWVEREDRTKEINGCPFCVLPNQEDARKAKIVAANDKAFVLLNNYPYNPGHVMVIPYTHTGTYRELDEATLSAHASLKQRTIEALADAFSPDGYNTGMNLGNAAGGSIGDHIHTHVIPRWNGDTNFMPVISETKVIVEAVEGTFDRLYEAFLTQDDAYAGAMDPVQFE